MTPTVHTHEAFVSACKSQVNRQKCRNLHRKSLERSNQKAIATSRKYFDEVQSNTRFNVLCHVKGQELCCWLGACWQGAGRSGLWCWLSAAAGAFWVVL
jgi:hypothetical protein